MGFAEMRVSEGWRLKHGGGRGRKGKKEIPEGLIVVIKESFVYRAHKGKWGRLLQCDWFSQWAITDRDPHCQKGPWSNLLSNPSLSVRSHQILSAAMKVYTREHRI